eukprot:143816-Hanusia_phi.AAC.3
MPAVSFRNNTTSSTSTHVSTLKKQPHQAFLNSRVSFDTLGNPKSTVTEKEEIPEASKREYPRRKGNDPRTLSGREFPGKREEVSRHQVTSLTVAQAKSVYVDAPSSDLCSSHQINHITSAHFQALAGKQRSQWRQSGTQKFTDAGCNQ